MGKHGNHSVNQIDTGSSFQCLSVKSGIFLHIISHIRDVYSKAIIFTLLTNIDGIIKILRILTIDGNHHHIPQIPSACSVCFGHFTGDSLCLS